MHLIFGGWVACAPPPTGPGPSSPPDTVTTSPTADTLRAPTADTGPPEPAVPLLDEALADYCATGEPGVLTPEDPDLHLVTLPSGRCNDGTPAVGWIRPAVDPTLADRFVVFLEGGGDCEDQQECADRWCDDPRKMSSRWTTEDRSGKGMLSPSDPANVFGRANLFVLHYCSSDLYAGTASDRVLDTDPKVPAYRVHFEGHDMVQAVFDALDAGVVSDDGSVALPPVGPDSELVLSGTSAGAHGAVYQLDRLAARYPGQPLLGLIDSGMYPNPEHFAPTTEAAIVQAMTERWDGIMTMVGAEVDAGCIAAHAGTDERWRCVEMYNAAGWVEAPVFIRFDHRDAGFFGEYLRLGATQLEVLDAGVSTTRQVAVERPDWSIRATQCGHHTTLQNLERWARVTVRDPMLGGPAWTLRDAAAAWVGGTRVVAIDDTLGTGSVCEP